MKSEQENGAEAPLDDNRRRTALEVCRQFRRGIITAEVACEKFLCCSCVEPLRAAEYINLLPEELRAVLPAVLAIMPTSDEEWANFDRYGQFDGSEWTWAEFILECRVDTEAVRACVLGEAPSPVPTDFVDRVRAVYRAKLAEIRRLTTDGTK